MPGSSPDIKSTAALGEVPLRARETRVRLPPPPRVLRVRREHCWRCLHAPSRGWRPPHRNSVHAPVLAYVHAPVLAYVHAPIARVCIERGAENDDLVEP